MSSTEFAAGGRRGLSPYEGLAARTGKPLARIVELASQNRLGELFDSRGILVGRPLTPAEALRNLDRIRYSPGQEPRSPAALIGELRARQVIWAEEERQRARMRNPLMCLVELAAKQIPPWATD